MLPSVRIVAARHGVGINTALAAFRRLECEGLVSVLPRIGFRVIPTGLPTPQADPGVPRDLGDVIVRTWRNRLVPGMVVLSNVVLPPDLAPLTRLRRTVLRAVDEGLAEACAYEGLPGRPELRRAIAQYLQRLGAATEPDGILITNGAIEAIQLALRAVCGSAGGAVAVESPGYPAHLYTLAMLGITAVPIPIDPAVGPTAAALERILRRQRLHAVLCSPVFANPGGGVMPMAARQDLLDLCRRHDLTVIEDDANGALAHAGPRPAPLLAADRHGLVLNAGSLTKTLGAGLQLGWLVGQRWIHAAARLKGGQNISTGVLPQLIAARLLTGPGLRREQQRMGPILAERMRRCRTAVLDAFPTGTQVTDPQGGAALWIEMPRRIDSDRLYADGIRCGIRTTPGRLFGSAHGHALRIAGCAWTPAIAQAITTLGALAKHQHVGSRSSTH